MRTYETNNLVKKDKFLTGLAFIRQQIKTFDWLLLASVFLLCAFGLLAIYSVSLSQEQPELFYFKKQIISMALGVLLLFLLSFLDYRALRSYSLFIYGAGLALLLGVLFVGQTIRGTTGWFSLGVFSFQPVEFAKIALIIFLAKFFSDHGRGLYEFRTLLKSLTGVAVFIFLVALQPDFGSIIILLLIWFSMLLLAGIRKRHLIVILISSILLGLVAWVFLFQDYQRERFLTYLNPSADPLGKGYNITQSIIAVGSGKFLGRGLSFGSQSQLRFLPEARTDFIFASLSEELGFVAVFLVLVFFGMFFYQTRKLIYKSRDDFTMFLTVGILVLFFGEMFINIGMNTGFLPVMGITLPFLSYGGSSLLMKLAAVGILQSVKIRG